MVRLNGMIAIVALLICCTISDLESFSLRQLNQYTDEQILQRLPTKTNLIFDTTVVPEATKARTFACLFIFDKEASAELNNQEYIANSYANYLAEFATLYAAHANINVINAGVELWSDGDRISFAVGDDSFSPLLDFLPRLQMYLNISKHELFGTVYTVAVLISNKNSSLIPGGYTQGPANTTSAASIIYYRPYPVSIAGLLAHELAHTLSVVHPFELDYLCQDFPELQFCPSVTSQPIPAECLCNPPNYPATQCIMTFQFGRAVNVGPRYTSCDIKMMNYFS